jgi:outer membrane receptor protein involved in Fe transport
MKQHVNALWFASTAALAFATPAWGQTAETAAAVSAASQDDSVSTSGAAAGQADESQPEEIIVTAQKRSERLIDVPQSVSVVSAETLQNLHAQRLSDYMTRIPSANIVESQPGSSRIVLRGINTGGVGATVATYIDETPFGSATALANGGVLAPDLDPFDLDRVEVLRGPQGTLYGANSLGGLVKLVTVTPNPGGFDAAGEISVENVAHGETGYLGRAAANVPLGSDAAVRVTGFYRSDPGYIDDPLHGSDVNDGKTYGGRLSFMARPTPALRIRASALMQNIRSDGTNVVDVDPVTLKPTIGKYDHERFVNEPNDINYRLYNATIDYDFGPVSLVSATSYGTLKQAGVVDGSGALGAPVGLDQGMKQRRFTQEVRLASNGSDAIEWTLGGFYTHESNRLSQNVFAADPATGDRLLDGLLVVALPSRYRELAGFANATWHIAPKFDLTAGGRYSHNRQSSEQGTSGLLLPEPTNVSGKSSDGVFTYSIAPQYKPNRNTTIYARVAKGYRPGGPNALSPDAPDAVPRQFGPDTTINYEVGLKTQAPDRLWTLELTAFRTDWKDIQLLVQLGQFGVNTNGGGARSKGIEFSAGLNPSRSLSLYANGAYVDAELTDDAILAGGLKGDRLPYNPKWQSTIGAEYEHPLSASVTGRAGISWHYTGSRFSDFNPPPAPDVPAAPQHKLDSFSQIDAHAGVDVGKFRIDAFVRNLTDSQAIVNIGAFGAFNGDLAAAVIMPRTFGLSLGVRY